MKFAMPLRRSYHAATTRGFLGVIVLGILLGACSASSAPTPDPAAMSVKPEVIVYVNSRCPYCKKARAFLEREEIPYEARDVRADARARAEFVALGGTAVPLFLIGRAQVRGLDPIRVRELVNAERARQPH